MLALTSVDPEASNFSIFVIKRRGKNGEYSFFVVVVVVVVVKRQKNQMSGRIRFQLFI